MQAAADIDKRLGIKSEQASAIGAWKDGAENSIVINTPSANPTLARAAAAMKGYIANQKSVLVFEDGDPDQLGRRAETLELDKDAQSWFNKLLTAPSEGAAEIGERVPTGEAAREGVTGFILPDGSVINLGKDDHNYAANFATQRMDGLTKLFDNNVIRIVASPRAGAGEQWPGSPQARGYLGVELYHPPTREQIRVLNGFAASRNYDSAFIEGGHSSSVEGGVTSKGMRDAVLKSWPEVQGEHAMASFEVKDKLEDLHNRLINGGVEFHTIEPVGSDRYKVHVFAGDQSTVEATDKVAKHYGAQVTARRGHGDFLGASSDEGSDADQRSAAKVAYERIIADAAATKGLESVADTWEDVRHRWRSIAQDATRWIGLIFDEAPGHPFRGNQYRTGQSGGAEPELPLTGGRMGKATKSFLYSSAAKSVISTVAKEAVEAGEHIVRHEAEIALIGTVLAGLVALGTPTLPAAAIASVAGHAMNRLAHKLGINTTSAYRLLKRCVRGLRNVREHATRMGAGGAAFPSVAFGYGDAVDRVLIALQQLDHVLSTHTPEQLAEFARRTRDEGPGHPFRGNQYTTGQSGGGLTLENPPWTFAGGPHGERWQNIAEDAIRQWHEAHPRVEAQTIALKQDLDQVMVAAEKYKDMKDWYNDHKEVAKRIFGEDELLFERFLAASSIQAAGQDNVNRALNAYIHYKLGGTFDPENYSGVMRLEMAKYNEIVRGVPFSGEKIDPFDRALRGDWDRVPADRHMKRLLFKNPITSGGGWQNDVTRVVVQAFAKKMGWKPAQLQAAMWAVAKARSPKGLPSIIFTYRQYLEKNEARMRAVMHTVRAFGSKMQPKIPALADAALPLPFDISLGDKLADAYRDGRLLVELADVLRRQHGFSDEEAGHPFRGNQYTTGQTGGGQAAQQHEVIAYHGTGANLLDKIAKEGLTLDHPHHWGPLFYRDDRGHSVFLTDSFNAAYSYGEAARKPGDKIAIFEVHVPEDDWNKSWRLDEMGPGRYAPKSVPPEWIKKVHITGYGMSTETRVLRDASAHVVYMAYVIRGHGVRDEGLGHPFRGNQYVSGESGGAQMAAGYNQLKKQEEEESEGPKTWDDLTSKQQRHVEGAWREENYEREMRYEIDNWHQSGDALDDAKTELADYGNA